MASQVSSPNFAAQGRAFVGVLSALALGLPGATLSCGSNIAAPSALGGDPSVVGGGAAGNTPAGSGGAATGAGPGGGDFTGLDPLGTGGAAIAPGCTGLACQQMTCANGGSTTISGTVYEPSGTLPLNGVIVYVPNAPLTPISDGVTCDCEVSGDPIASTLTGTDGAFVLTNAPVGANIPLVVQIGKWRREFTIPSTAECSDTPVADQTFRLPANQAEGHIPRIALTTGSADALECLIPKLGIDPAEFTAPDGTGRLNYFAGHEGTPRYAASFGGADFPPASDLWGSVDSLSDYDIVLLSCEGGTFPEEKGAAAFQAMHDYANLGGRVFASHWHEVWFQEGPDPFPDVATFVDEDDIGDLTANVVTTFPKGQALSEWLVNVGATTVPNQIQITAAQYTVLEENPALAQRWIASDTPPSVQYMSANTPLGASDDMLCGRVVLSDIHVNGGQGMMNGQPAPLSDTSDVDLAFPDGCVTSGFSPQERVLVFMLFDLSACIVPDDEQPVPPDIILR